MKLSVSAYRAHASAHKKILSSGYHSQLNYGSTGPASSSSAGLYMAEVNENLTQFSKDIPNHECNSDTDVLSPAGTNSSEAEHSGTTSKHQNNVIDDDNSNTQSSGSKSPNQRKSRIGDGASDPDSDWTRSNQRWMKLRTTVQISSAIQKKPPLKREDSFLKRFSTRQMPDAQETVEDTGSESAGDLDKTVKRRRRYLQKRRSVVNPDENFYFYWLMVVTISILYNLWTLIVRQSFPELQKAVPLFWIVCDAMTDIVFILDIVVQLRTGYLEQGLMVYDDKKLACHYVHSKDFFCDMMSLIPLDLLQLKMGTQPLLRFMRFFKVYRSVRFYYIVESRTVWPNLWRVVNLIHILLILAHWFGCFYYLLSEAEGFQGDWVYPYRPGDYATLTRKYLGSLYWSTLTLTTIGDLPTPETNAEYIFTIVSYLIGVFIFATIVGQVGNVITNRNANRLEFERLLDGAKTYMRHHKVPGGMKRRVLRWYDYSWSRGRIQGGGDINTALGLLPDKLKTELALHVNLSVLKKVTIFQECQPEFLHDLVLKMKAYIFTPGDSICRKGEVAREMFIIADGILEVLSETGKVLTTMKAGDFFGEIGILNLDGLNKRTADVRSVGYSELFSLSREDVLAAMKDYPDAQEILQTLGRKRLMEVRCVNKKYAKAQLDKQNAALQNSRLHAHPNQYEENSSSKKMVEKLKNDVRGFKSVLRKTRTSKKQEDVHEMEPLHSSSRRGSKSVLKRMPRVRSDEKDDTLEVREELRDMAPSPIGAGLPLLQRLRLLKEKQDREERAVKYTASQKSPPNSHITHTLSPQESIQEEPEREVNEGLPLIQRLQYLKAKNAVVASESPSLLNQGVVINKLENQPFQRNANNAESSASSIMMTQTKPTIKVSFKQRLQKLQSSGTLTHAINAAKSDYYPKGIISKKDPPKTLSVSKHSVVESVNDNNKNPISTISNKIVKPSIITSSITSTPIKPWSKLKLATILSSSYSSLTNSSPDDNVIHLKNYSMGNIPQMMTAESTLVEQNSEILRNSFNCQATSSKLSPKSEFKQSEEPIKQTKFYQSVFDLSPEYNGLPFVKRLKILNERQKLAELEKALQTRSFSLDCSKTGSEVPRTEALYRCYSDTSGIYSQYLSTFESSSTTSTNTSNSENSKNQATRLEFEQHEYLPLSPESNETFERRQLKSILKKINKCGEQLVNTESETKGLTKEPTIAGPPDSVHEDFDREHCAVAGSSANNENQKTVSTTPLSAASTTIHFPQSNEREDLVATCQLENKYTTKTFLDAEMLRMSDPYQNEALNQVPNIEAYPEGRECFNQILYGINNIIKTQITEMHSKFETQFSSMACEVKKRDAIISHLQKKLRNMEQRANGASRRQKLSKEKIDQSNGELETKSDENSSSESSSAEFPFMRGDSLDTVFTSSPPIQSERRNTSPSTSQKHLPEHSQIYRPLSKYSRKPNDDNILPENQSVMLSNITGNLTRVADSIILDMGDSSSTCSSSTRLNTKIDDEQEEEEEEEDMQENAAKKMHHNDWEVRMLAAEMEKQERKRFSLSENSSDLKNCGTFLRRRRKFSDTETDFSESETEDMATAPRPRASSLDQFNLRYGIGRGIFKAMSIDRDKDKL